jgi:amino acid transporter
MATHETPATLRKGQLRAINLFIMSMALVGPGAGAFFNLSTLGSIAGPAMVLSVVLSLVAALLLANTVAQFAGRVPGAGMFYTFVSRGLGSSWGFLAGWILMADYGATTAFGLVFPSDQVSSFLHTTFGLTIPWWLIFLVALGAVLWLSIRGIRPSLRTDMIFLAYELAALLALALTVLFKVGPAHWSAVPFAVPKSGFGGVGLAWVLGITAFLGFEGSITASEEAESPRRVLPRALFAAVIVAGIFFVVTSYAGAIGYGPMGKISQDPLPWNTVANHFWGTNWGILVDIGAWVSMFAVAIASQNASARLWFAMGREHVLPSTLGRVSTERAVPLPALYLQAGITLVVGLGLGLLITPFTSFLFLATILSLGALIVWIMAGVSLIRFMRGQPQEFRVWPHLIFPILSILIVLPPMYSTVYPVPAAPLNIAIYVVVAWILVGVGLLWRLSRTAPQTLANAGRFLAAEE